MIATFTKLSSGKWGLRVVSDVAPTVGMMVPTKKSGFPIENHEVQKVLWSGLDKDGTTKVHICEFVPDTPKTTSPSHTYTRKYKSRGCTCSGKPGGYCCGRKDCQCFDCL